MVLDAPKKLLQLRDVACPRPNAGQLLVRVSACAVCRTDLHIVDGELPEPKLPLIPGHEIVGRVEKIGRAVKTFRAGNRVGIPIAKIFAGVRILPVIPEMEVTRNSSSPTPAFVFIFPSSSTMSRPRRCYVRA